MHKLFDLKDEPEFPVLTKRSSKSAPLKRMLRPNSTSTTNPLGQTKERPNTSQINKQVSHNLNLHKLDYWSDPSEISKSKCTINTEKLFEKLSQSQNPDLPTKNVFEAIQECTLSKNGVKTLGDYMTRSYSATTRRPKDAPIKLLDRRPKTAPQVNTKEFMNKWIISQGEKLSLQKRSIISQRENMTQLREDGTLADIPLLSREGAPTLADWRNINKYRDTVGSWNRKEFSLRDYLLTFSKTNEIDINQNSATGVNNHIRQQQQKSIMNSKYVEKNKSNRRLSRESSASSVSIEHRPRIKSLVQPRHMNHATKVDVEESNRKKEKLLLKIILKKTAYTRSEEEVKKLKKHISSFSACKALSEFILSELCQVMTIAEYEPNRAVFSQGDSGTAWFIVFSGKVSIQISRNADFSDVVKVANLGVGCGFGEMALLNDLKRQATIITDEKTELIRVEKQDYLRVMKFSHENELKEKIFFLSRVPVFAEWSLSSLKSIALISSLKKLSPGTVIMKEGDEIKDIFFIKKGTCDVFRNLKTDSESVKNESVFVGKYSQKEYFGEEVILNEFEKDQLSRCTIIAAANTPASINSGKKNTTTTSTSGDLKENLVEVVSFSIFNVKETLRPYLSPARLRCMDSFDIQEKKYIAIQKKHWNREKEKMVKRMIEEIGKLPTLKKEYMKKKVGKWRI